MAQEWNIRPRGHVCSICAQPLVDKKPCVSVLREVENTYERLDCHVPCWQSAARDWEPFSLWEGDYEAPAASSAKEETVKKETAESLLRRLITLEDPAMQNVVYVLAVMLERSKQLVERDAKPHESGGILRVYEHKKSGDTFVVLDPRLRLDRLGEVQQQVIALLSGTHALGGREASEPEAKNEAPAAG